MSARELQILIVEDDEVFRRDLQRRLARSSRFDATIEATETLEEAREALRASTFDVGLFDYHLPDGEAIELVETITLELEESIAPIIITAMDDEHTRAQILAAGAQDFLVKGEYDDAALERSVLFALSRKRGLHLRNRLSKAERLAALGHLVADLAHQFNNPLAILSNNVQFSGQLARGVQAMVDEGAPIAPEALEPEIVEWLSLVDESRDALGRISRLVRDIQLLRGKRSDSVELQDVNEVVRDAVRACDAVSDETQVEWELEDVPLITVDGSQMRWALGHAIENAVEAAQRTSGPDEIVLKTAAVDQGVEVCVIDSGPGVPPDVRDEVFRPFFSTKPPSKGRGLGLSLLLQVVRAHGGRVAMESKGDGACLRIWLPRDAAGMDDTSITSLYGDTDVEDDSASASD